MANYSRASVTISVIVLLTMAFAACSLSSKPSGPTTRTPKFGGSIIDGLYEEPDSLMPEQAVQSGDNLVDGAIWAPLFYGDNTGVIQPGLAKEVPTLANGGIETSADGRTMTLIIHLRSGLKWSDGSPLTSDDVVFTLNLFKNPAFAARWEASEFQEIASVTDPDPTTIVINLNKIDVAFIALALTDTVNAPMPKEVFGKMAPASIAKSPQAFWPTVTSGPFTITQRVKSDHITVRKNADYFQAPLPYLAQVTFQIIPNESTILTNLQSGAIDTSWFLPVTEFPALKALAPNYRVALDKTSGTVEQIFFNETNPYLADPKVRKAITMGIDVTPLIKTVWQGIASLTCDDASGTFAHEPSLIPCYTFNQAGAESLLESDGFTMGSDGYFQKDGKDLELRYATTSNNPYRQDDETIIQDQLKHIGIKIVIINYPADTLFGSILYNYSDYDIVEYDDALGYDPDNHTQWGCNQFTPIGYNVSHYCNPEVDAAIQTELSNPDVNARKAALHIIHEDIIKDLPAMFLYQFPNISCVVSNLENYSPSPAGSTEAWNIWEWWLNK